MLQMANSYYPRWKSGDVYEIPQKVYHLSTNAGMTPNYHLVYQDIYLIKGEINGKLYSKGYNPTTGIYASSYILQVTGKMNFKICLTPLERLK